MGDRSLPLLFSQGALLTIRYGISHRLLFPSLSLSSYQELLFQTSAHWIQWREKDLSDSENRPWIERGVELARRTGKKFLVNSDSRQAAELGADGVHLTSQQSPASSARPRNREFLIGQSVHSLAETLEACDGGVDYLIAGPVFPPLSKQATGPLLGVEGLRRILEAVELPVFPIGGIHAGNQEELLALPIAGLSGITWLAEEIRNLGLGARS